MVERFVVFAAAHGGVFPFGHVAFPAGDGRVEPARVVGFPAADRAGGEVVRAAGEKYGCVFGPRPRG